MRLAVYLTRRQIRAVIAAIEDRDFTTGGDSAERLYEAYNVLKQVEVDDPPVKHGPKCPRCGHSQKGHRYQLGIGRVVCQVNSCPCHLKTEVK